MVNITDNIQRALQKIHCSLDLTICTRWNKRLQNYASPIPDKQAISVGALSWKGMWGYAFPPTAILMQVLNKIMSDQCRILLIAPAFPAANWFQVILGLLENPLELPPIKSLLKQPRSQIFHRNLGKTPISRLAVIRKAVEPKVFFRRNCHMHHRTNTKL